MYYSEAFKKSVIRKVLPPENRSILSVAKEMGVAPTTVGAWLKKAKKGILGTTGEETRSTPNNRPVNEKFRLLLEAQKLNEQELGSWLRIHGLHSEHLSLWQRELEGVMTDKQQTMKEEIQVLRKENQKLKKDAKRNEKAMAEALALLTLKKKLDTYYREKEED